MIGSIVTSLSRGGLIGLAVFLIAFALWPARSLVGQRRQKALLLGVLAIGVALVAWRIARAYGAHRVDLQEDAAGRHNRGRDARLGPSRHLARSAKDG